MSSKGFRLVGYHESKGQVADLLLRCVTDVYARWLADASSADQARSLWKRHNDSLLVGAAQTIGKLFAAVPGLGVADKVFQGLSRADADLKSGGLLPAPLEYDQALELLRILWEITEQPIVLILDAWEKSPSIQFECDTLEAVLKHLSDWPHCHFLVGIRQPEVEEQRNKAAEYAKDLADGYTTAEIYPLRTMHLDEPSSQAALLAHLRVHIEATRAAEDDWLLARLGGFPGAVGRWLGIEKHRGIQDLDDLTLVAEDAHAKRYREFDQCLRDLDAEQLALTIRLCLLPALTRDTWTAWRDSLLDSIPPAVIDRLLSKGVLESSDPPSLGHDTRHKEARRRLLDQARHQAKDETEQMLRRLGSRIRNPDASALPLSEAVLALGELSSLLDLHQSARTLIAAVSSLFPSSSPENVSNLLAGALAASRRSPDCAPLLAMGLFNTLNDAKAGEDLERRDTLLDELRALATKNPEDASVPEWLASGLFNTLIHAKAEEDLERRDALLDELRALATENPDDATIRDLLARGLVNTLIHAKAEEDLERRDALLDELRTLATENPDDAIVREWLTRGLFNTLNDAKAEEDLERRDTLLDELRALATENPNDATIRDLLARGLVNTLIHTKAEEDLERRDTLLDELRALAIKNPDDANVRDQLAMGLVNTLNDAKAEEDLERRDTLLDELRTLAIKNPDDANVREWLASGLFNTLNHAKAEDDLERRDALLDQLRTLAIKNPDDANVREWLASGLFNTLNHAKAEEDLERRDTLLDELRTLAIKNPEDATVRDRLAIGLFNTLIHAKAEEDLERRDTLLDELRALAIKNPDDANVRDRLARGLVSTLIHAKAEEDLERRDTLLDELRALAAENPDDANVRVWLARGLVNTQDDAPEDDAQEQE